MLHLLRNGTFIAPFYVFIKSSEAATEDIIRVLQLSEWDLHEGPMEQTFQRDYRHFYLTRTEGWLHIMDDGYFTLWHDQAFRRRIPALSRYFPIFTCWVSDSDQSFGFQLFSKGNIVREYIVENADANRIVTFRNHGKPLKIEKEALQQKDPEDKVLSVASGLGINVQHNLSDISVYWKKLG